MGIVYLVVHLQYAEYKMAAQFFPKYLNIYEHYRSKMETPTICKVLEPQICQQFQNRPIFGNSVAILVQKTEFVKISHCQVLVYLWPLSLI